MTIKDLEKLSFRPEELDFVRKYASVADAWDASEEAAWMVWLLQHTDLWDKSTAIRCAVGCADRMLPQYEQKYPGDDRPRRAIAATKAYVLDPSETNRIAVQASIDPAYDAYATEARRRRAAARAATQAEAASAVAADTDASYAAFDAARAAYAAAYVANEAGRSDDAAVAA